MIKALKETFEYREMLFVLVKRDLKARYKGTFLGYLWTLLMPMLQLLVYTLIFGSIFGKNINSFPLFLFVGLLPWNAFSLSVNTSTLSIVKNKHLIKKIYFPKTVLPIQAVITACVDQLFGTVIIVIALLIFRVGITWHILLFPLIMILQIILFCGFAFVLSTLFVKIRDLQYIVNFIVMMLFYMTPIIHDGKNFSKFVTTIIKLNPLTSLIEAYRNIFLFHQLPSMPSLLYLTIFSIALFIIGLKVFSIREKTFAEDI